MYLSNLMFTVSAVRFPLSLPATNWKTEKHGQNGGRVIWWSIERIDKFLSVTSFNHIYMNGFKKQCYFLYFTLIWKIVMSKLSFWPMTGEKKYLVW